MIGRSSTVAELTDTITDTIDQIELGDAVSRLADVAASSMEVAAESAAVVGAPVASLGSRAAHHTIRNPKKALGTVAIVVAIVALVYWLTNRDTDDRPDASDHPGVV